MQSIQRMENLNICDDKIQSVAVAEETKAAINTEESPKATYRKFAAENNVHLQAMPEELIDALVKYGNNSDGIPALNAAIKSGDEQAVRLFLDHGASPNSKSTDGRNPEKPNTALEYAAKYGQLNIAKLLVERGAKIEVLFEYGALIYAAQTNQPDIIKFLFENGAKITSNSQSIGDMNFDPIYCAIQSGSVAALNTFLDLGGKLDNPQLAKACDLLQVAAYSGKIEMVKFLLDKNVPTDPSVIYGSALCVAVERDDIEMTKLLISRGAKAERPDLGYDAWRCACGKDNPIIINLLLKASPGNLNEKLFAAVNCGKINVTKALIAGGADVNARDKNRMPLIYNSVRWPDILQFLIDKGASVNPVFDGGNSLLHIAALSGVPESLPILIKHGAQINGKNACGQTPLWFASRDFWCRPKPLGEQMIIALLERGADPNIACGNNPKGKLDMPLHLALNNSPGISLDTVKLFVKCGASINGYCSNDSCPLENSIYYYSPEEGFMLLNYILNKTNVNINSKNSQGRTPLIRAVECGNFSAVELLINKGADINAKDNFGRSSLSIAKEHRQEMVEWLIAHGART